MAIIDVPDRSLNDVEFTTAVESVAKRDENTKVLINPNVLVFIDERDDNEQ